MDDPEKVKSIKGVSRVWAEESTELNKADFDQIDLRVRGKREMQITCTFNPIDEEHWLNVDFWQNGETEDVALLHTTYLDNRFIGEQYAKVMDRLKEQDPRTWEIYALGKWGKPAEGLIFTFEEIDAVPDSAKFLAYGLDFGFTNDPSSLIGAYSYDKAIVLDEVLYQT